MAATTAPVCASEGCEKEAVLAIRTTQPKGKEGIVTTLYMFPEDAPKTASLYCVRHGMHLAAELARLSDPHGAKEEGL